MHRIALALLVVVGLGAVVVAVGRAGGTSPPSGGSMSHDPDPSSGEPLGAPDPARATGMSGPSRAALETAVARGGHDVRLVGRVIAPDGSPVGGAVVALVGLTLGPGEELDCAARQHVLEADGRFEFALTGSAEGFESGYVILRVEAEDWATASISESMPIRDGVVDVGDVQLLAGAVVAGRVTDLLGNGIAAADVVLRPSSGNRLLWSRSGRQPDPEWSTDGLGGFRIERVTPGRYRLEARARGRQRRRSPAFEVHDGETRMLEALALDEALELRGTCRTRTGEPVAGARVMLGRELEVSSDEAGRWLVEHVPIGAHRLRCRADGFVHLELEMVDPREQPQLALVLEPGLVLRGRAVDASGAPVEWFAARPARMGGAGAPAEPARRGMAPFFVRSALRAEPEHHPGGVFELDGIEIEGRYRVKVQSPDHLLALSDEVVLRRGMPAPELRVVLAEGARARGRVVDGDGQPLEGVEVTLEAQPRSVAQGATFDARVLTALGGDAYRATSAVDGSFDLGPVEAGSYRLLGRAEGLATSRGGAFELAAARSDLELVMVARGTVAGTVHGVPAGRMGDVVVRAARLGPDRWMRDIERGAADGTGGYRLELTPGTYLVWAALEDDREALTRPTVRRPGDPIPADAVRIAASATIDRDLQLAVTPRGGITGYVFDRGVGAAGFRVRFERARLPGQARAPARGQARISTDAEGRFAFEGLEAGHGEIVVHSPIGAEIYRAPLTVARGRSVAHDVRVALGEIEFSVGGASPAALHRGSVSLSRDGTSLRVRFADSRRAVGVPSGEWRYYLAVPGHRGVAGALVVGEGPQTLELEAGAPTEGGRRRR